MPIKLETLPSGDYIFADIAIERKNAEDLHSSLVSGRIYTQMRNMESRFKNNLLLIESYTCDLKGKLVSLILAATFHIFYSERDSLTVSIMSSLYKGRNRNEALYINEASSIRKDLMELLLSVDGINSFNISNVMDEYINFKDLSNSSQKRIIETVGENMGKRIYEFFNNHI